MFQKIDLLEKIVTSEDPLEDRVERLEEIALNSTLSINENKDYIRKNGIEIAHVRHLVVLNDIRISENLDLININEDDIEKKLETSISNVTIDLQNSIDFVKLNLEDSIDFVKVNLENSIDSTQMNLENSIDSVMSR